MGTDATLAGRANYEIKDAVAAKIADCERVPELSSSSELSATPSAFWEKVWLPEPGRAAEPGSGMELSRPAAKRGGTIKANTVNYGSRCRTSNRRA